MLNLFLIQLIRVIEYLNGNNFNNNSTIKK